MATMPEEQLRYEARRHGIVLARPFALALFAVGAGAVLLTAPWPVPAVGAVVMGIGALAAVGAVWRWDRTRVVVTTEKILVLEGPARRPAAGVRLARVRSVEVRQSSLGRLLGYGTLVAGRLKVRYVPKPRELEQLFG